MVIRYGWLLLLALPVPAEVAYHQDFAPARRGLAALQSYQPSCRLSYDLEVYQSPPASLAIRTDPAGRGGADLTMAVEPGHAITVRWSYRGEEQLAADAAMVRLGLFDRGRRRIPWPADPHPMIEHHGAATVRPGAMTLNVALPRTTDWRTVELRLRVPVDVGWLLVNLCAFHGGGTVYYDDVVVEDPGVTAPGDLPRWAAAWPDPSLPAAGYPPLDGVEEVIVHRGDPSSGSFNHIPRLTHHDNTFYLCWNNHPRDEDELGQRILGSRSTDGLHWSAAEEWCPPAADRFLTVLPMRFPDAWQIMDGRLHLVASTFAGGGGARGYHGELARTVDADGRLGPVQTLDDPTHPLLARRGSWAPFPEIDASVVSWQAEDGNRLIERTTYRRSDGVMVALARQAGPVMLLYAALSRDNGRTWSAFRRTNIPDSPSLTTAGTLPDGRIYLIHSPASRVRDPLVISLSTDGITFDQTLALRHATPPMRHEGRHKLPGFQYPSAVVVGDSLWVAYAIGKEDIAVARVPLSVLSDS